MTYATAIPTTNSELAGPAPVPARIAVAIPCFNEAAAIALVVARFRAALPEAEIVVFDNNSTDGTGAIARGLGVRVVDVPEQGKGHAVRFAFAALADFDVLVLTDGDGTYPAEAAPLLVAPVLEDDADMAVGARQPTPGAGAMTFTRGLGNRLIRTAFRLLIGPGNTDLLSGYRAFNRRFRATVVLRAKGFEIETELASEAVARELRVIEISVPYFPRIAGTQSKLRAFRDGFLILGTIVRQSVRLRPIRVLLLGVAPLAVLGAVIHWAFAAVAGLAIIAVGSLFLTELRARRAELRKQKEPQR
jgi:glycosyltransferase involved in cell wall biosynthesis